MSETNQPVIDNAADAAFIAHSRTVFRAACAATDSDHAARLAHARRAALATQLTPRARRVWVPFAGAVAACALAVGVVWIRPAMHSATGSRVAPVAATAGDADAVLPEVGSGQMEMVRNLDFYRWLATQPPAASTPVASDR